MGFGHTVIGYAVGQDGGTSKIKVNPNQVTNVIKLKMIDENPAALIWTTTRTLW